MLCLEGRRLHVGLVRLPARSRSGKPAALLSPEGSDRTSPIPAMKLGVLPYVPSPSSTCPTSLDRRMADLVSSRKPSTCIRFEEAQKHIGATRCVTGKVLHVKLGNGG